MRHYQRPWWLVVNKSAHLNTTIEDDAHPGERIFLIRGEPLVQGLAWLIWGPVAALLTVGLLVWLAVSLEVSRQPWNIRGLMILLFLFLPAIAWGGVSLAAHLLAQKHLQTERHATRQECMIRLNQKQNALFYQTTAHPSEEQIPFAAIQRLRIAPALGSEDIKKTRLLLETDEGPIVLLNEQLGNFSQKKELTQEIEQTLAAYTQ